MALTCWPYREHGAPGRRPNIHTHFVGRQREDGLDTLPARAAEGNRSGLGGAGQIAAGLAVIDDALARAERTEGRWCIAEQLRTKGELLLLRGASGAAADAEECFRRALDWA